MSMMTPQILESVYFTKTQKYRYLKNETLFFLHIKDYFMAKNSFVAEVTFHYFFVKTFPHILISVTI